MMNFRHRKIVQALGVCRDEFLLIMEYMEHGSLEKILESPSHKDLCVWSKMGGDFALDIVEGIVYLHSMKLIHFDLKPDNIMVNEGYIAKIGDFGSCKILINTYTSAGHSTPVYAPPEPKGNRDLKSDIYSLGVIMWELCASTCHPAALLLSAPLHLPLPCLYLSHSFAPSYSRPQSWARGRGKNKKQEQQRCKVRSN